jgi:hypothetical protein
MYGPSTIHIVRKHVQNCKGLFKAADHIHAGQKRDRQVIYCTQCTLYSVQSVQTSMRLREAWMCA